MTRNLHFRLAEPLELGATGGAALATPAPAARRRGSRALALGVRVAGAGLLGAMAGIHLHLYAIGYRDIATIGPLFLLNGILGALLAVALLVAPRRLLALTSLAGGLLLAGTLGGLVLSLTAGLFGFVESTAAPFVTQTIAVESAGTLLLLGAAAGYGRPWLAERVNQARRTT